MNRRGFIEKILNAAKTAVLINMIPQLGLSGVKGSAEEYSLLYNQSRSVSLKELSSKKMHHGNHRFLNPFMDKEPWSLWRGVSFLASKNAFKALYQQEKVTKVSIGWEAAKRSRGLSITFLKHAGLMVKDENRHILIDPVFFGLYGVFKDFSPIITGMREMPNPDHVLITHGHYDHLDKASLACLEKDTHTITPLGHTRVLQNLDMVNHTQMDWFDTFHDGRLEITLLPCNHWSMRNPVEGPNRSLWGSFYIRTASGVNLFIAGDTAYHDRFEELGKEADIDIAIFNLGAYEPRWFMSQSHLNPQETIRAFKELNAKQLMVVHWGTFRLGHEPVFLPPLEIHQEMEKQGLLDRLIHINHGQTIFHGRKRS